MDKLLSNEQKKQYILQHWNRSSGKRIAEMLKRYFASPVAETGQVSLAYDAYKYAQKIFLNGKS